MCQAELPWSGGLPLRRRANWCFSIRENGKGRGLQQCRMATYELSTGLILTSNPIVSKNPFYSCSKRSDRSLTYRPLRSMYLM
jgi:hypothetical protein